MTKRRKTVVFAGVGMLTFAVVVVALALALRHEPSFYRQRALEAGPARTQHAEDFVRNCTHLINGIENQYEKWGATITEEEINSYLAERFIDEQLASRVLPDGVSDLRVALEDERIRVGFRYGTDPWSTVISFDLKMWKAPGESNVVVVRLEGLYAGAVPVSSKFIMDRVAEAIRSYHREADITWHRHEGKLAAVIRFGASRTVQLDQLKVADGKLSIMGRSHIVTPPAP